MRRRRGLLRVALAVVVLAAVAWSAGLFWFIGTTRRSFEPPPHTDGIVALTGGAGRVELALRLLADGRADRLLLSGIGGGSDLGTLGRLAGIETAPLAGRITVGRYAASTRGNGVETAAWAEQNQIGSLIVVTAAYHMPRALAELRRDLPEVKLYPLPVGSGGERGSTERGVSWRLEAAEYTKFLLTVSGIAMWFPRREADGTSVSAG